MNDEIENERRMNSVAFAIVRVEGNTGNIFWLTEKLNTSGEFTAYQFFPTLQKYKDNCFFRRHHEGRNLLISI